MSIVKKRADLLVVLFERVREEHAEPFVRLVSVAGLGEQHVELEMRHRVGRHQDLGRGPPSINHHPMIGVNIGLL